MLLYHPEYCYCSIAATLILLVMYFMKRNYSMRSNIIFFIMLLTNLITSIFDVFTIYTISFPDRYPLWLCYAANEIYLFIFNFMSVLFMLYIDSKTKIGSIRTLIRIIAAAILIYDAAVIFTTHFTHQIIYFDNALVYQHGPLMVSLYVTAFIPVAIADAIFTVKRKMFNVYQVLSINIFAMGVLVAVIFQVLNPSQLICDFVCAMVLFFVYTAFENQAYYLHGDTLCYNRRAFIKTIDTFRYKKGNYLLAIIKIGEFENIKQSLGRLGVDDLAEKISERICRVFGKSAYCVDINCFAIIKPHNTNINVLRTQIAECFKTPYLMEIDDDEVSVSVDPIISFVRAKGSGIEGFEMTELVSMAPDRATEHLLNAQDADEMIKPIRREKEVLRLIDNAIKNNGFKVYYQPILDIKSGNFTCSEALIRLVDERAGFVGPEEFIPIAEKHGRIHEIGDYVFRDVCRFIKEHNILSRGVHYVEINLSPKQCNRLELANQLISVATEYGVDFRQINLEITETAELESGLDHMNSLITNLHQKGITFSLDDFGSGFAAIDYLIKLPVDIVKIDKGILWQAMDDEPSMTVLKNTIRMIKEVGKKIVVEGIETTEMADLLIENGCDYLQGYLYSKPLPESEYLKFLSNEI